MAPKRKCIPQSLRWSQVVICPLRLGVITSAFQELGQLPNFHFTNKETEVYSRPLGQLMTELRLDISQLKQLANN